MREVFPDLKESSLSICYDEQVIWNNVRKSSSSGLPNLRKKGTQRHVVSKIVHSMRAKLLSEHIFKYQWLASIVYQPSDKGYKGRIIYMPPFEVTILEIMFGSAIQDYLLQSKTTVLKIGKLQMDLHDLMKSISDKYKVTGDFSSFDVKAPSFVLLASADILKQFLKMDGYEQQI